MKNQIAIFTALLLLASCASKPQQEALKESLPVAQVSLSPEQLKSAGIITGKSETKMISSVLKLNGNIDVPPQNMVSVSFPLGGYLKSTKLLPGMFVKKGEVLAVMEDAQYIQLQQDYLITKSKIELTEAEYKRQQELNAGKAGSDKILQQAKSEFETQKIVLKSMNEKLQLIGINPATLNENNLSRSVNIYSPIAGFVSKVNVNIGKYTSPTDVLFELVNPDDIHLALMVFEKDIQSLATGQKVIAYTNNKPDQKFPAEIILISRNLDENRAAEVHCHFEKYDETLLPGMFMNAEVNVISINATVVPAEAVVRWQNKFYVFEEKSPGTFELLEVQTGIEEEGMQQISSSQDLNNKKLVLKNAYALLMKMKNSSEE